MKVACTVLKGESGGNPAALLRKRMIMAKPIEPTPVLKGDDAYEFVAEMEKLEKASAEEKARVAKGASFIQSLLTFTF